MQLKASVSVRSADSARVARTSSLRPSVRPVPSHALPFQGCRRQSVIRFVAQAEGAESTYAAEGAETTNGAEGVEYAYGVEGAEYQTEGAVGQAVGTEYAYERTKLTSEENEVSLLAIPQGYHWYETMMIMKENLSDEERDKELAKFEAFLNKDECVHINALVRGRSRMAYPIKNNWEGIYVLYTYAAKRQTAKTIQKMLSTPEAGAEDKLLRHITFCRL